MWIWQPHVCPTQSTCLNLKPHTCEVARREAPSVFDAVWKQTMFRLASMIPGFVLLSLGFWWGHDHWTQLGKGGNRPTYVLSNLPFGQAESADVAGQHCFGICFSRILVGLTRILPRSYVETPNNQSFGVVRGSQKRITVLRELQGVLNLSQNLAHGKNTQCFSHDFKRAMRRCSTNST